MDPVNGNGSYGVASERSARVPFPAGSTVSMPGNPPAPRSPLQTELDTQAKIIEELAAAVSRLEAFAEPVLRSEPERGGADTVEKRPVDYAGSSGIVRAVNEHSNTLVYLLRRVTRVADRLEA